MARIPDDEGKRAAICAIAMILGLAMLFAWAFWYSGGMGMP
jgi:hypothetical protein